MGTSLGERYARALMAKDWARVEAVLAPDVSFRGLTPGRAWEASGAREAIDTVFTEWLEPTDEVTDVLDVSEGQVAGRGRVAYRFAVTNPGGRYVCEQTAYYDEADGRIGYLRVLCSGFLPVGEA